MKTTKLYPIGLIAILVFTLPQHASAQDFSFFNQMFSNMLSNRIWDSIYEQSSPGYRDAKKRLIDSKSNSSTQASTGRVTPDQMNRAVQFKSVGTRLMTEKFAKGSGKKYKQDKAGMKEILEVMLERYDNEARAKGLANDLSLALVSYIGLNSRIYSRSHGEAEHSFWTKPRTARCDSRICGSKRDF